MKNNFEFSQATRIKYPADTPLCKHLPPHIAAKLRELSNSWLTPDKLSLEIDKVKDSAPDYFTKERSK